MRAALIAAFALLVAGTASATTDPGVLRPYWTGPVWGAFTNVGPDSVEGAKAQLNVPIGVRLTEPVHVFGKKVDLRAEFKWTTKAYLGEPSEPLQDATYEWFPLARVQPDSTAGFWHYTDVGPDHISNGDDGTLSRSMNAISSVSAFAWTWSGIEFEAYVKIWYVYDFGENTEPMKGVISLFDNFGAQVLVRGRMSMIDLAAEFGPDWQKYLGFVPLKDDFYHFGGFIQFHNGKLDSFLDPTKSVKAIYGGVSLTPPHL